MAAWDIMAAIAFAARLPAAAPGPARFVPSSKMWMGANSLEVIIDLSSAALTPAAPSPLPAVSIRGW
jgi:hypothetical protein